MITLSHVSKQFDALPVITDISFQIGRGEVVGFLGPNGAGKTTTVRMIAGVLPPSQGSVTVDGQNLFAPTTQPRPHIGYLPENNPIYDDMTVEEFLQMWANLKHIPPTVQRPRMEAAVEAAGLSEVFYRPIAELSKGYRQRTGLAQAILSQPDILLLDEPTEGLDPNQRQDIHRLLKDVGKERTVIICSHVLSEITKMCSRILIINKGQIVADSPTQDLGKLAGGRHQYEVIAQGKTVASDLKSLSGVTEVTSAKDQIGMRYQVIAKSKMDLRLAIFELAKKQHWKLYELTRKQQDLEDIFGRLTKTSL